MALPATPANYILAAYNPDARQMWTAVYVGETDDIEAFRHGGYRSHPKWPCAVRHGVSEHGTEGAGLHYIHVRHNDAGEAARKREVNKLAWAHRPPCGPEPKKLPPT